MKVTMTKDAILRKAAQYSNLLIQLDYKDLLCVQGDIIINFVNGDVNIISTETLNGSLKGWECYEERHKCWVDVEVKFLVAINKEKLI